MRTVFFSLLLASGALAGSIEIPPEGILLQAGQRLSSSPLGRGYYVTPAVGKAEITSYKELFSKPPNPGVFRFERTRKHYRDKALNKSQAFTVFKGIGTEWLYDEGKDSAEKSKADAKAGKGSTSVLKRLFGK